MIWHGFVGWFYVLKGSSINHFVVARTGILWLPEEGVPHWLIIGLGYMCFLCGHRFIMAATMNSMISPNSNTLASL